MLVLNRRVGEEILIGNSIRVFVVGIRGGQVRLGFEAPRDVPIVRQEIHRDPHHVSALPEAGVSADEATRLAAGFSG